MFSTNYLFKEISIIVLVIITEPHLNLSRKPRESPWKERYRINMQYIISRNWGKNSMWLSWWRIIMGRGFGDWEEITAKESWIVKICWCVPSLPREAGTCIPEHLTDLLLQKRIYVEKSVGCLPHCSLFLEVHS